MRNFFILFISLPLLAVSQYKDFARDGNDSYEDGHYEEAASLYRKSIAQKRDFYPANFNLGNTNYLIKNWDGALSAYQNAVMVSKPLNQARSFHNLGNTYMEQQKYDQAIQAYQKSLLREPTSEPARYNLALAMQRKVEQQKQKSQNKKNDKNKDRKENKNKQQNQQQKNNQQQKSNTKKPDKDKGTPPKQQKQKMSKDEMRRLLRAVQKQEKDAKKRIDKKSLKKAKKYKSDKDW